MAFDGIVTRAMVRKLQDKILLGKIEKVYQPEADELVFHIHTKNGNVRLFASAGSAHARVCFINENPINPPAPLAFCMLLRKHLQGGRITEIKQKDSERIIEISLETLNELGFTMSKKLIFEIMGKHSNIILVDIASGKIIDSIKRVSFDSSRVRQVLPGMIYQYPPAQGKIPFAEISDEQLAVLPQDGKAILRAVGGIAPAFAEELATHCGSARTAYFRSVLTAIDSGSYGDIAMSFIKAANQSPINDTIGIVTASPDNFDNRFGGDNSSGSDDSFGIATPSLSRNCSLSVSNNCRTSVAEELVSANEQLPAVVYFDETGKPLDFYPFPLSELETAADVRRFGDLSTAMEFYFDRKETSNQGRQKSHDLIKSVTALLDKMYLKKKRLSEDLLKAENSEDLRLYGELLTANIHLVKAGMKSVEVINYYDGSTVSIPLDVKQSPAKNAQMYFKKYGKSKTAIKEKQIQLEENENEIKYLESVLVFLENTDDVSEIEAIRSELIETGYVRRRKQAGGFRDKKYKPQPYKYTLSNGMSVLVGRNNKENDILTCKTANSKDLWLHTKDIPGSHVIVQSGGIELDEASIWEAAAIAAYHSKARSSENVPVDYVTAKYVKKPAGAKPGMVIFTNNRTVWVNPALPASEQI